MAEIEVDEERLCLLSGRKSMILKTYVVCLPMILKTCLVRLPMILKTCG